MIQEIRRRLRRIYIFMITILCCFFNVGAVRPGITKCSNSVIDQRKEEELEWNWVVKPGEYEECLFLGYGLIAVKKKS